MRRAIVTFCLLALFASPVSADLFFGPEEFTRHRGKPDIYTETFPSWITDRDAIIRVTNGNASGGFRVSSAEITLNGEKLFGPRDFNQTVGFLQTSVILQEMNTLVVELRSGEAGSHITLEVDLPFFEEIPGWKMPELAVTSLTVEPERANPGDPVQLCATVTNVGKGETPGATLLVFVDGTEIFTGPIAPMEPGAESRECTPWQAMGPGHHEVRAELDLADDAPDFNAINNIRSAVARVSGDPNSPAEVEFRDIDFNELALIPGQPAVIPLVARNPGFAEIQYLSLNFFIDDVLVHSDMIEDLPSGAETTFQVPWALVTPGEHTLRLQPPPPDDVIPLYYFSKVWSFIVPDETLLHDVMGKHKWVSVGPSLLDNGWGGRMNSIAFNPSSPSVMYSSGLGNDASIPAAAGVWKTVNGGSAWKPVGDKLPSMQIRTVAVDPKYPDDIIYAGGPQGIFKSVNGGTSWTWFAHKNVIKNVTEIFVRSTSTGVLLYVSTNSGVYRYTSTTPYESVSSAAGWDRIKQGTITDLALHPTDDSKLYASIWEDGLYRTTVGESAKEETTAGDHDWTKLTTGLPAITSTRSLKFDIHELYPSVMYATVTKPVTGTQIAIYRSMDGGDEWKAIKSYADKALDEVDYCPIYNPYVRVAPLPLSVTGDYLPEVIYFGGVCLYQFVNYLPIANPAALPKGGTYLVSGYQVKLRAGVDHKALEFDPATKNQAQKYYYSIGDQGVFRCSVNTNPRHKVFKSKIYGESGDSCVHRNTDLRVTEFYDFDVSATNSQLIIGGAQDTGTLMFNGDGALKWKIIKGGDGLYSLINPYDNNILYAQHQSLNSTVRSTSGVQSTGATWKPHSFDWLPTGYGPGWAWITMNQFVPDGLVTLGSGYVLLHTTNGGSTFNGQHLGTTYGKATKVIVHPTTLDWIIGTNEGRVLLNPRDSFNIIPIFTHDLKNSGAIVDSLSVSPADPNILYVAFRGTWANKDKRLYYIELDGTDPAASVATHITDNYPVNLFTRVIAADAHDAFTVYAGTDKGVWRWKLATGGSFKWEAYNNGLPLTTVVDLMVAPDGTLLAATKGRGAWRVITGP